MPAPDGKWKQHLLRTSVPLEYEAAKILSQRGFNVSANYPYHRIEAGVEKEFSVDVRGVIGYEPPGGTRWGCVLDLLVECKYRDRGMTWLFLPQPKSRSAQLHEAIQGVDFLSARFVHGRWSFKEDEKAPVCYSAVEVGKSDVEMVDAKAKGRALESQLRHGIRQLQYALPALIGLRSRWVSRQPPDENFPFFFVPLLLTNARLLVAHQGFGICAVEKANNLEDLGTIVPYVIWSGELGPDFDGHCQRQLASLPSLVQTKNINAIEERRKAAGIANWLQPSAVAARIALDGGAAGDIAEFTNVIVVNLESLPKLVDIVGEAFLDLAKSIKEEPVFRG
jgi:hypothetical protein